jgi:hypothetical protein
MVENMHWIVIKPTKAIMQKVRYIIIYYDEVITIDN